MPRDNFFCECLAADVALYADNDAVERIPAMWTDDRCRRLGLDKIDHFDDFDAWWHVAEPFPSIVATLGSVFTAIRSIETSIGIEPHSIIDNCARSFGTESDYRLKASVLEKIAPYLDDGFDRCGSPIERMMAFGLLVTFAIYGATDKWFWTDGFLSLGSYADQGDVIFGQQVQLGQYRVDFLLGLSGCNRAIVIECDGHEFHERTKAQAQRDKSRDRWLQTHGYLVLRFTGSEIHYGAAECASEIFDALKSLQDRTK